MAASSLPESVCLSLTPEKQAELAEHTNDGLLKIIRANYSSQFASQTSILAEFRDAVVARGDLEIDDGTLIQDFHKHVPLSDYEAYRSFIEKFSSQPCKESDVEHLLAPGLPYFLISSSATSGTKPKLFPRYKPARRSAESHVALRIFNPGNPNPIAAVVHCGYEKLVEVEREPGQVIQNIAVCAASGSTMRVMQGWTPDDDESRMSVHVPGYVAPCAAMTIKHHQSFLRIHGLFSLACRDLGTIFLVFLPLFVDLIRNIEDQWDTFLDCIRDGTIPNLEGTEHVRTYLQSHFHANPDRAAELREIGPPFSCEGWATRVWPNLTVVVGTCSGPFATVLPKARFILGPNIKIVSSGYGSSECHLANQYGDNNTFIIDTDGKVFEFLDVTLEESHENVIQSWEVEPGKKYELVLTTRDGLWRYELGDVVEIVGFDISTGLPLLHYSGRKSLVLRLPYIQITDDQLLKIIEVINSEDVLQVQEFTTVLDTRRAPQTVGFFVELSGPIGPNAHLAPKMLFEALAATSVKHEYALEIKKVRYPTIRVLKAGTFAEYRRWRSERMNSAGSSQVKVPVVAIDPTVEEWMSDRVIEEF